MKRRISCLLLWTVLVSTASLESVAAKEEPKGKPAASVTASTSASTATKQVRKPSGIANKIFVPPPPPVVPTLQSMVGTPGELLDLMSDKELGEIKDKTTKQLSLQDRKYEDLLSESTQAKTRADNFESLFKEGVVSKRELEAAKKDADRLAQELEVVDAERKDLASQLKKAQSKLSERQEKQTKKPPAKTKTAVKRKS